MITIWHIVISVADSVFRPSIPQFVERPEVHVGLYPAVLVHREFPAVGDVHAAGLGGGARPGGPGLPGSAALGQRLLVSAPLPQLRILETIFGT